MTKPKANILPTDIGNLYQDAEGEVYRLLACATEPMAKVQRIRDVEISIEKPISEFAGLVRLKLEYPIEKVKKLRADKGGTHRKPKVESVTVITPELRELEEGLNPEGLTLLEPTPEAPQPIRKRKQVKVEEQGDNLTIHVPTGLGGDTEYEVNIAGSEARGPTLRSTILKALEFFSGEIPPYLNEQERATIQGILGA